MDNDEAFLRALADSPADNCLRLVDADWLDERGDPRAGFLRIQQALTEQVPDETRYRHLCEQEQDLVHQLDPIWIQRVRRFTTGSPCRDIARLVPDLAPYARTTTRLHPHRTIVPLPMEVSKIGGHFLWPVAEPWPSCPECGVPLASVVQLRARDVPQIAFPSGTDLFQLFWCPEEEAHEYQLAPHVWWWNAAAITRSRIDSPDPSAFAGNGNGEGLVPVPCSVYPEQVVEHPLGDDLYALVGAERAARIGRLVEDMDLGSTADLAEQFSSEYGPSDPRSLAFYELGQCPGSKVGGKPGFEQGGRQFDHLVTLSTWEFDSASFRRWLPVEDQRLLAPPGKPLTWIRLFRECNFRTLQEATGMQLGRTQNAHVFVCRDREPGEIFAYISD